MSTPDRSYVYYFGDGPEHGEIIDAVQESPTHASLLPFEASAQGCPYNCLGEALADRGELITRPLVQSNLLANELKEADSEQPKLARFLAAGKWCGWSILSPKRCQALNGEHNGVRRRGATAPGPQVFLVGQDYESFL